LAGDGTWMEGDIAIMPPSE